MPKTDDGLEAIVFTAQGDMRQGTRLPTAFLWWLLSVCARANCWSLRARVVRFYACLYFQASARCTSLVYSAPPTPQREPAWLQRTKNVGSLRTLWFSFCPTGINNLQSTFSGFGYVKSEYVFKVCDQPHPLLIRQAINVWAGRASRALVVLCMPT